MWEEWRFIGEGPRVVDACAACAEEGGGCGVLEVAGLEHEAFYLDSMLAYVMLDRIVVLIREASAWRPGL